MSETKIHLISVRGIYQVFFYLSKLFWFVAQPSAAMIFMIFLGFILQKTRWAKFGQKLIIAGAVVLFFIAFSPLGRQLMIPLEDRFAAWSSSDAKYKQKNITGFVVLGGTIEMNVTDQRGIPSIVSGAERIIEAVKLSKAYPKARIVLTGGPNTVLSNPTPDSVIVKNMMIEMGVEANRIVTEASSRNTWQNAINSKKTANPKAGETWVLITSAYHMPRAMGAFRQAGFDVIAYPVDYYTGGEASRYNFFYYAMDGFTVTDIATKEWLGLLAYKLTGRSNSYFPSP